MNVSQMTAVFSSWRCSLLLEWRNDLPILFHSYCWCLAGSWGCSAVKLKYRIGILWKRKWFSLVLLPQVPWWHEVKRSKHECLHSNFVPFYACWHISEPSGNFNLLLVPEKYSQIINIIGNYQFGFPFPNLHGNPSDTPFSATLPWNSRLSKGVFN